MRDVSKYTTVGEWYADFKGRVPPQMAGALDNLMRKRKISFPEAYALLVEGRAIIEIDDK
jgi:hypothetical protein